MVTIVTKPAPPGFPWLAPTKTAWLANEAGGLGACKKKGAF